MCAEQDEGGSKRGAASCCGEEMEETNVFPSLLLAACEALVTGEVCAGVSSCGVSSLTVWTGSLFCFPVALAVTPNSSVFSTPASAASLGSH